MLLFHSYVTILSKQIVRRTREEKTVGKSYNSYCFNVMSQIFDIFPLFLASNVHFLIIFKEVHRGGYLARLRLVPNSLRDTII